MIIYCEGEGKSRGSKKKKKIKSNGKKYYYVKFVLYRERGRHRDRNFAFMHLVFPNRAAIRQDLVIFKLRKKPSTRLKKNPKQSRLSPSTPATTKSTKSPPRHHPRRTPAPPFLLHNCQTTHHDLIQQSSLYPRH